MVQEEFVDYYDDLLFADLPSFNEKLLDWLTWYNCERLHAALGQVAPLNFAAQSLAQSHNQCHIVLAAYTLLTVVFTLGMMRQNAACDNNAACVSGRWRACAS